MVLAVSNQVLGNSSQPLTPLTAKPGRRKTILYRIDSATPHKETKPPLPTNQLDNAVKDHEPLPRPWLEAAGIRLQLAPLPPLCCGVMGGMSVVEILLLWVIAAPRTLASCRMSTMRVSRLPSSMRPKRCRTAPNRVMHIETRVSPHPGKQK